MGIPAPGYGYADSHSVPTAALGFVDGSREWGREEKAVYIRIERRGVASYRFVGLG